MFKPLVIPFLINALLAVLVLSCQPGGKGVDAETQKLQREVDSLRQVKEALKNELEGVKEDDGPRVNPPDRGSNTVEGQVNGLTVLSAKKQFDDNFNPILRITFRNNASKSISTATIAVDFSFNSEELSPNCNFEKKISLNLAPNTNQTITLPIPADYGKNCADKAWVVVKEVFFSDGSKK